MDFNITCGIVIGPRQVDYVLIKRKKSTYLLIGAAYYDFSFEKHEDLQEIVSSIESFIPSGVLSNVCFIHPETIEHLFFYDSSVSDVKMRVYKDLKETYEIELKDYLIDYEVGEVNDKKAVLVCAIPARVFYDYYKAFEGKRKLRLFAAETPVVSLKREIATFEKGEGNTLYFSMRGDFSRIFVLKGSYILVNRQLQMGFDDIVNSLQKEGGLERESVIQLLREYGFDNDELQTEEQSEFYLSLTSVFDRFSIEIQRTIDYFTTIQKLGEVDLMGTVGFINKIKDVDKYLSRMFSMKAKKVDPRKEIEFSEDIDFSVIDKMAYFDACVGAALRSAV